MLGSHTTVSCAIRVGLRRASRSAFALCRRSASRADPDWTKVSAFQSFRQFPNHVRPSRRCGLPSGSKPTAARFSIETSVTRSNSSVGNSDRSGAFCSASRCRVSTRTKCSAPIRDHSLCRLRSPRSGSCKLGGPRRFDHFFEERSSTTTLLRQRLDAQRRQKTTTGQSLDQTAA